MTLLRLALAALLLATPAAAQQAPATDCDRMAGFDFAPRLPDVPGLPYIYQPQQAIAACEAAVAQYPDEPYFRLFLARAYLAVDADDTRGTELLRGLHDQLPGLSMGQLAALTVNGLGGIPADPAAGRALYEQACDLQDDPGRLRACNDLGLIMALQGNRDELPRAADLFRTACDGGLAGGCLNLGYAYSHAEGVDEDLARAAQLYQQACDGGDPMGCNNLGNAYRQGRGVEADAARAVSLFLDSCQAGEYMGCDNLGEAFRTGTGTERNPAMAVRALSYACDGGLPTACVRLAGMALDGDGEGLPPNPELGQQALQRACTLVGAATCDRAAMEAMLEAGPQN